MAMTMVGAVYSYGDRDGKAHSFVWRNDNECIFYNAVEGVQSEQGLLISFLNYFSIDIKLQVKIM